MNMFISRNNSILAIGSLAAISIYFSSCSVFKTKQKANPNQSIAPTYTIFSVDNYNPKKFNKVILKSTSSDEQLMKIENVYFGYGNEMYVDPLIKSMRDYESNWDTYHSFKSISVFPTSKFDIDESIKPMATKVYMPLVDSIIHFRGKYTSRNLIVQLFLVGYTDAIVIGENSDLYQQLKVRMKNYPLTKSSMNKYLSYLRACEIGKLLSEIILSKNTEFERYDKVFIQLVQEGKGEELPDTKKRYKVNDEDRRVVKIYWKVIEG